MNQELLECARYGEHEDLLALLEAGADVNYQGLSELLSHLLLVANSSLASDSAGNTALHKGIHPLPSPLRSSLSSSLVSRRQRRS
jgi:hypothetical protein